ncbi:hypothetical protein GAE13_34060 [Bacteroides thetaiotaomicron]|nr:hypothetical protein GAE13_34060 [Bacteroides thetaiotaomicron]
MPKKKAPEEGAKKVINPNVMGLRPEVLEQPITETLEINYMPYAMSVIVSRAIPLSQLKETGIFESLAKMKYEVPNDGQEKFAEYDAAIEDALRQVNEANR